MAKFDLGDPPGSMEAALPKRNAKYYPSVTIPKDIGLKVGSKIKAVVTGVVIEVSKVQRSGRSARNETRLDLHSMEIGGTRMAEAVTRQKMDEIEGTK